MPRSIRIDFVSDVACPWCVIGLRGLEEALARTGDVVDAQIHFQPFELRPDMTPEGTNVVEYLTAAYNSTPEQIASNRAAIRDRAAALGFDMAMREDARMWNTFDAHRLLYWAGLTGGQQRLKHALFTAYHGANANVSDREVLVAAAISAGLDGDAARDVLDSGRYAQEVREAEELWRARGINSVPAIVIDGRYLISGGQPPEAFEQALRQIATEPA